jgi:hypothetical protein
VRSAHDMKLVIPDDTLERAARGSGHGAASRLGPLQAGGWSVTLWPRAAAFRSTEPHRLTSLADPAQPGSLLVGDRQGICPISSVIRVQAPR